MAKKTHIYVVYPKEPLEYEAFDGKKVHTLFFLFASSDKDHLHILAKLAHLTRDEKTREFLAKKPSHFELMQRIKDFEANLVTNSGCFKS